MSSSSALSSRVEALGRVVVRVAMALGGRWSWSRSGATRKIAAGRRRCAYANRCTPGPSRGGQPVLDLRPPPLVLHLRQHAREVVELDLLGLGRDRQGDLGEWTL